MSTALRLPHLHSIFSTDLQHRILDVLHDAALDTQGRGDELRRATLGLMYGDLVARRMKSLSDEVSEGVLAVDACPY